MKYLRFLQNGNLQIERYKLVYAISLIVNTTITNMVF